MDRHPVILFLPRFFRFGTYLNVQTGTFDSTLVMLRFAITIIAISYNVWSLLEDKDFAKLHDLLYFIMIISHQVMSIASKDDIVDLIRNLQAPLRNQDKRREYLDVIKDYTYDIYLFGTCMVFLLCLTSFWSLTPILSLTNLVDPTTNRFFNLPLNWISNSTQNILALPAASVISVLALVCGNIFILNWYPPMLYSVCKIKLKIRMLAIDMATLNDRAALHCQDYSKSITESFRSFSFCPYCNKGPAVLCAFGIYKDDKEPRIKENKDKGGKHCCKRALGAAILQDCYKGLLKDAVDRHVEIIKLVLLLDRCYRLSVMIYNQFGILFPLLLIPKISILASLPVTEILYGCTEIGGICLCIFIINYVGQTVLDEERKKVCYFIGRLSLSHSRWCSASLCQWEDAPVSVRRSLLIMQTMATRDLRLTAGTMYTLSMDSFKNIMRAAYSYASLLQSLDDQ